MPPGTLPLMIVVPELDVALDNVGGSWSWLVPDWSTIAEPLP